MIDDIGFFCVFVFLASSTSRSIQSHGSVEIAVLNLSVCLLGHLIHTHVLPPCAGLSPISAFCQLTFLTFDLYGQLSLGHLHLGTSQGLMRLQGQDKTGYHLLWEACHGSPSQAVINSLIHVAPTIMPYHFFAGGPSPISDSKQTKGRSFVLVSVVLPHPALGLVRSPDSLNDGSVEIM